MHITNGALQLMLSECEILCTQLCVCVCVWGGGGGGGGGGVEPPPLT